MKRIFTLANKAAFSIAILSLSFLAANSQSLNSNASLSSPVKYGSFDASISKKSILLNWSTVNEVNNSHFEVERSFDGNTFKTVGLVLGALEVNAGKSAYKFKESLSDLQGKAIVYYRLKPVDMNGKYSYSAVWTVNVQPQGNNNMSITDIIPFNE